MTEQPPTYTFPPEQEPPRLMAPPAPQITEQQPAMLGSITLTATAEVTSGPSVEGDTP